MRPGVTTILALVAYTLVVGPASGDQPGASKPKPAAKAAKKPEFPPFAEVSKGYVKIVPRGDDAKSLYTLWIDRKRHQLLAELGAGFDGQKIFIATSIAGGSRRTGWQWREQYCYWTRHDKKLVLMEPQLRRRAGGGEQNEELAIAVNRTYNDRVITSVPIIAIGPNRRPVIDLDALLVGKAKLFTEMSGTADLARLGQVKAFPKNIEIPVTIPMKEGEMTTLHYSISVIPKTDYKPRDADDRIGYFMTVYKDLTRMDRDGRNFVRRINRWHVQKRDSSLAMSPPVEPIVFYIEHTVPVRYRRYVRQGILEWNKAFEKCGILDAIEVRQQDAKTGAFMDFAPEDVRYNFFRWISSEVPFAMGPSRVNPETGQILDADIIFDDSMLKYYAMRYQRLIATIGFEGIDPAALRWIADRPHWNPMMVGRHVDPDRVAIAGDPGLGDMLRWDLLEENLAPESSELVTRVVQQNRYCGYAAGKAMQMRTAQLAMRLIGDGWPVATSVIDGVPESYLGAILKEIVMHEVGHTLGLRHNFKASAWLTLSQYVQRTGEANVGSVMDYNPIVLPASADEPHGDWVTPTIGPYDYWAIEYGYTLDDTRGAELLQQVAAPEHQFATDEDVWGPDPLVGRFDLGAEPLDWAERRLRLVTAMREKLLEQAVEAGESWYLMRQAYELLMAEQVGALRTAGRYLGGVHVHRDHRGDVDARDPLVPTDVDKQRRALRFIIDNAFRDESFDTRPEVLRKLAADKNRHWGNLGDGDTAFSVTGHVAQIQSFALLYVLNPGTLTRVWDNELRTPADDDALTLPELLQTLVDAIYAELDMPVNGAEFTNRKPMISALRRSLQSMMTERMIDLAMDGRSMPRPVQTLARGHLWRLSGKLDRIIEKAAAGQVDEYTLVHLSDMNERIAKTLNAVYLTGTVRSSIGLGRMARWFVERRAAPPTER